MFKATYFELLYSVWQRHISHQPNVSIPVVWSSNVIYWNVVHTNNKNFNNSILLFHFTASLLNSNNSNNLCSSDKMSVIVSQQEQFDAPENFSHSGTHTHTHTHSRLSAVTLTAHEWLMHPQPTNVQPTLVFTFQIGLRFIVPAACLLAIITEHPPHLHPSAPRACKLSAIQSCFQRSMVLPDSNWNGYGIKESILVG
jgi:hypothetical protein